MQSLPRAFLSILAVSAGLVVSVGSTVLAQTTFTDVTAIYGLETYYSGLLLGGGAAWVDVDDDGDFDLVVACGTNCELELFRNEGPAGFSRESFLVSIEPYEEAKAIVFADCDEDGDPDMFCSSRPGRVRLVENTPSGYTKEFDWGWGQRSDVPLYGLALADYDGDGDLDLYCGDHGGKNRLYRNDGDIFVDVASDLNVTDGGGLAFQVVWFDYDNDGDQDLYMANDKAASTGYPNALYRNEGDGTFKDVSVASGANFVGELMGLGIGDYDNDGDLDFYNTNTPLPVGGLPGNLLGRNNGDGTFTEVARGVGVATDLISWGANFFDADNDGDLDLFVATMHNDDSDRLYFNNGDGTFFDGTFAAGVEDAELSFGSTIADYDDDGDLDLYVTNSTGTSRLLRNNGAGGNWLKLRLRGSDSNRDAIGARVIARDGLRQQIRELRAGNSYLCNDAPEIHFGFGPVTLIDEVEIRWPSGQVEILSSVGVNQTLVVNESLTATLASALSGTVGTAAGPPVDVLFLNGSAGDEYREVSIDRGVSMRIDLNAPPNAVEARYVLYAAAGRARTSGVVDLPMGIGKFVYPLPANGGMPLVTLNTLGYERILGASDRNNLPFAPLTATRSQGIGDGVTLTLQALIKDPGSSSTIGLSASNAVILHVR